VLYGAEVLISRILYNICEDKDRLDLCKSVYEIFNSKGERFKN